MLDRVIDPQSGDYVEAPEGGTFAATHTAMTKLYHQIKGERDRWVGDPDAGSRLYTLPRKASMEVARVGKSMVEEAVKPLLDLGIIDDYQLEVDRTQRGALGLLGSAHDALYGELQITPLLPGGV